MSAWVIVCVAVQVIVPPGARRRPGWLGAQTQDVAFASVTVTLCKVTLPSLVATIV